MDIAHRLHLPRAFEGIQKRIRSLSIRPSGEVRTIRGISLVLISLGLGFTAYQLSTQEALLQWDQGRFPGAALWRNSLKEFGYEELKNPNELQKGARFLPARTDPQGAIWASPDFLWIAITREDGLLLFGRGGTGAKPAREWKPLGRGWSSYENTLAAVARIPPPSAEVVQKPKNKAILRDPRQLVY